MTNYNDNKYDYFMMPRIVTMVKMDNHNINEDDKDKNVLIMI